MNSITTCTDDPSNSGTAAAQPDTLEALVADMYAWPELTALVEVILDYAVEPMDLWLCNPPQAEEAYHPRKVEEVYDALLSKIRAWEGSLGAVERKQLDARLPVYVSQEIAKRLVEVITPTRYYEFPDSLFH